jgi:hypothetical protein
LCTLFLLNDAVMKFVQPSFVVEAQAKLGLSASTTIGIGVALLVGVILYAIPVTAALGAIILTGYLGGAVFAHVHEHDPAWMVVFPAVFGALVWLGLVFRDARLRSIIPIRR